MQDVRFVGPSWDDLKRQLGKVEKPARYIGGEVGAVRKDLASVDVTFALAFPDVYEVGVSHLGSLILYSVLNSLDFVACERVYMPWTDMEELLRDKGWPLFSIESRAPLGSFDIIGFSLQYELTYTNILAMLDLGGIPLRSEDRGDGHP
ncbi:MAG: B12-binding domain-containing radical SAM protein, partial [Firmicutes bacterium]|nr:B12-binding domain-containing radical SAM protein [Candidatus Fermentithermobacillaceae bacterium]